MYILVTPLFECYLKSRYIGPQNRSSKAIRGFTGHLPGSGRQPPKIDIEILSIVQSNSLPISELSSFFILLFSSCPLFTNVVFGKNELIQWHHFFPGLFFYVYIESPNQKKPRRPHTTGPKPHQLKIPTPTTQNKTPKPQTTINEQNK